MAWLEAHDELLHHPKTAVLSASMGWNKFETVGRLLGFWWWCLKYAPTGDLRKFNDAALASAVELNGDDAQRWVKALVEACWLDRGADTFRVHDWPDFTKSYLKNSKFNGRPDKWDEVLRIYPENKQLREPGPLKNNSRVNSRVTRTTNQPNQPTNKGRSAAEKMIERIANAKT